jgi:hypothetical protein
VRKSDARLARIIGATTVCTLVLALTSSVALGAGGLSSVILKNALPGFAQVPSGALNGPINNANLDFFTNGSNAIRTQLEQGMSDGQLSGFIRVWRSQVVPGDGLVLVALQLSNSVNAAVTLSQFDTSLQLEMSTNGGAIFNVSSITGAQGYDLDLKSGTTSFKEYVVAFAKGDDAFLVSLVSSKLDLTNAEAVSMAKDQWSLLPGSAVGPISPNSPEARYHYTDALLYGLLAGLVVGTIAALWLRRRAKNSPLENVLKADATYGDYKALDKAQRKVARKALVKKRLSEDDQINAAALEWARHNMLVYWVLIAAYVAFSLTVIVGTRGRVYPVSLILILSVIGVLNLRSKNLRFQELLRDRPDHAPELTKPAYADAEAHAPEPPPIGSDRDDWTNREPPPGGDGQP